MRANTQPPADGHLDNSAEPAHPLLALHRNGVLGAPQWGRDPPTPAVSGGPMTGGQPVRENGFARRSPRVAGRSPSGRRCLDAI
ncbi:hypothetical protein OCO_26920 [Mycobacterium intracellulare MOTT-02]|nr:hypothetical protein OCO_26920 [Mycobacterium intracellulare MOTT-02]AFC54060.1 hypothetical protein OCQ_25480 [Mycobacterium paraintracellulare]ASW85801.1 molybdenum ABC transporter permease [Mycobacterium intracellulare]ASW95615.1 molybdenum ABC transporter permease [Mycobacterium intracellulare]OSC25532.1 molybdenum ABC transporter permease [Mycobacterium paraintracellulare]